jgi:hypothetical protein
MSALAFSGIHTGDSSLFQYVVVKEFGFVFFRALHRIPLVGLFIPQKSNYSLILPVLAIS